MCFVCMYACSMILILSFGIYITMASKKSDQLDTVNLNRHHQVQSDWRT
jgi:hypothetical protein